MEIIPRLFQQAFQKREKWHRCRFGSVVVETYVPLSKSAAKAGATAIPAATTAAPKALGTWNLKPAATAYKKQSKRGKNTVNNAKSQRAKILHRI